MDKTVLNEQKYDPRIIEGLRFLENTGITEVNGKKVLTVNGEIFNAEAIMSKERFIHDWVIGFTLGYVGEKSYFDFAGWMALTNEGRTGMQVVDNEDPSKVHFIIPSFVDLGLRGDDGQNLMIAAKYMSNAASAIESDISRASDYLRDGKEFITQRLGREPNTLTDLVPDWIYKDLGIIPDVYRQMIFCRDRYGIKPETDEWRVAEACFTRMHHGYTLHPDQKTFLDILTQNEFVYPENLVDYKGQSSKSQPQPSSIVQNFDEC